MFSRGVMTIQIRGLAALNHMIHRLRQSNRYKEGGVANVCPPPTWHRHCVKLLTTPTLDFQGIQQTHVTQWRQYVRVEDLTSMYCGLYDVCYRGTQTRDV